MGSVALYCLLFCFVALGNIQVSVGSDHQMAQSACMGSAQDAAYVSAIPRTCSSGKTCESICAEATSTMNEYSTAGGILITAHCVDAFHIYSRRGQEDVPYHPYVVSWKYGVIGCFQTNCGPNFCCCIV